DKEWFSNILVTPAEDQNKSVDGYDTLSKKPELYSYPQLYYSEEYNIIPIGFIIQEAHI
ncbi:6683_t:CDS:2, partial [Racocetra persica]